MADSPNPPPRRALEGRSLVIVAIIVAVALAIYLFIPGETTPTSTDQSGGPDAEWQADPQPVPQLPPENEAAQEPAN